MKNKGKILAIVFAIAAIAILVASNKLIETNESGHFQVKQAFITGDMTVRTTEGVYGQWLGTITTYKNVATIGFGREQGEGTADISAIPVIFSDGSKAVISGLVRLRLPAEDGIKLKREYSNGYNHFVKAGILPVIRNAVKLSANLRSAQDAYTTLALFQQAVQDQVEYGTYVTKSDKVEFKTSTGDTEVRQVTVIVLDESGKPLRKPNRLMELNCEVLECVIDVPLFDAKVQEMIALRKDEAMKTELAKQSAIRAKQDAITAEEQGKANVAEAKYLEEVVKVKAVTVAEKEFAVAKLTAQKEGELKKAVILKAEAKKKELEIADGLSEREKYALNIAKETAIGVAKETFGGKGLQLPGVVVIGENKNGQIVDPFTAVGLESFKNMLNPKSLTNKK